MLLTLFDLDENHLLNRTCQLRHKHKAAQTVQFKNDNAFKRIFCLFCTRSTTTKPIKLPKKP